MLLQARYRPESGETQRPALNLRPLGAQTILIVIIVVFVIVIVTIPSVWSIRTSTLRSSGEALGLENGPQKARIASQPP